MRTAHGIYRTLQQFLEESDRDGYDDEIDMDFRSVRPESQNVHKAHPLIASRVSYWVPAHHL